MLLQRMEYLSLAVLDLDKFKFDCLNPYLPSTYTKKNLIDALVDIFDIMYKDMDVKEYVSMLNQLSVDELRSELPVEEDEMKEFMEPYLK